MANNYTGNYTFSNNGIIIPDTADILTTVQNEYKTALGEDLSLEESTPQGRLIDTEVTARVATIGFNAQVANTLINILMASGSALDAWGGNFDTPRNRAYSSRVPVLVTGVAGTVIPANSEAITSKGIIWKNETEIIIKSNGQGLGDFICSQTGPIELGIGELNTIVSSSTIGIEGWETITNTAVATLGADVESDTSYKLRILESLYIGSALFGNYASACYRVDGVQDVFVYENPFGTTRQLDNITMPAHSVFVCVDGGKASEVAQALYEIKSAGCAWVGNTTVVVTDPTYNTNNTVIFQTPNDVQFSIEIDLTTVLNSSSNLENDIKELIVNYFNNQYQSLGYPKVDIRANIDPFIIAGLVQTQITGVNVNAVRVGLVNPVVHATARIIKATITSGIEWSSVNPTTFATQVQSNGTYNFTYNGSAWTLDSNAVNLETYGINVIGTPVERDIVSIAYSNGNVSASPITLYVTEKAVINPENITVKING